MTEKAVSTAVEEHHEDEGHSIAAWTSVVVMLAGITVATLAAWFVDPAALWTSAWTWTGIGILVVGIILWPVLKVAGLGPKAH